MYNTDQNLIYTISIFFYFKLHFSGYIVIYFSMHVDR